MSEPTAALLPEERAALAYEISLWQMALTWDTTLLPEVRAFACEMLDLSDAMLFRRNGALDVVALGADHLAARLGLRPGMCQFGLNRLIAAEVIFPIVCGWEFNLSHLDDIAQRTYAPRRWNSRRVRLREDDGGGRSGMKMAHDVPELLRSDPLVQAVLQEVEATITPQIAQLRQRGCSDALILAGYRIALQKLKVGDPN